jgi:hypothetical protein
MTVPAAKDSKSAIKSTFFMMFSCIRLKFRGHLVAAGAFFRLYISLQNWIKFEEIEEIDFAWLPVTSRWCRIGIAGYDHETETDS